ncbi:MAG: hypothetical protein B7Z50_06600 [Sphingomonadales bacterium 12-62-5]|nr:MAG: hypothetical protein B7Z50_06600 [Sphingomonadales bacterium 12-62-5]
MVRLMSINTEAKALLDAAAAHEPTGVRAVAADALAGRQLRFYDFCMAAFAVILICSNLIGASKPAQVELPVVVSLPPDPSWKGQAALAEVFGQVPRIFLASILAFWAGEMANAFVLARMKLLTSGRMLWTRTIGSTVVGQGVDSLIFYPLAFWGIWEPALVFSVMATNYALKVLWEALLTPVTYRVVAWFKAVEGLDVYDTGTDFTPFKTKV